MVKKRYIILLIIVILIAIPTMVIVTIIGNKKDKEKKKDDKPKVVEKKGDSPEIKLLGREEYVIVVNGIYEEYGAKATDTEDGDLSESIKIDSFLTLNQYISSC